MALVKDDLAANLKKYRKLSGMTIHDVGALIGKSGKTVSAWENGRGQPDADMLIKLCSVLHISSVSELLGSSAPAAPSTPDIEAAKVALFGGDGEVTDEMWEEALFAAQLIKERHRRKNDE